MRSLPAIRSRLEVAAFVVLCALLTAAWTEVLLFGMRRALETLAQTAP